LPVILLYTTSAEYIVSIIVLVAEFVGITLGVIALAVNTYQRRWGQSFAWSIWLCLCSLDISIIGPQVRLVLVLMRIAWIWFLINWTFSRKGHSWSMYPSFSGL
jgi:hypothetical protein